MSAFYTILSIIAIVGALFIPWLSRDERPIWIIFASLCMVKAWYFDLQKEVECLKGEVRRLRMVIIQLKKRIDIGEE